MLYKIKNLNNKIKLSSDNYRKARLRANETSGKINKIKPNK